MTLLLNRLLFINFDFQKNKKKVDEISIDELADEESHPSKQQKVQDDRKLVSRVLLPLTPSLNNLSAFVQKEQVRQK